MQSFTEPRSPRPNADFAAQRERALARLDLERLDCALVDLIRRLTAVRCCFPVASCCGHFVILEAGNRRVIERLPPLDDITGGVLYQAAYLALCVDDSAAGRDLLRELRAVPAIAPERVQFGCVDELWARQVNTFVLQVLPWPHRFVDEVLLSPAEAQAIETARSWFFNRLDDLVRDLREGRAS